MVHIDPSSSIGEIAVKYPQTIPCLDRWNLEFCCGGDRPLSLVCEEAGVSFERLVADLVAVSDDGPEIDWSDRPLLELTRRLIDHYHVRTREELSSLEVLSMKALSNHAGKNPELGRVRRLVDALMSDIFPHMLKEETILFPWVERLCAVDAGDEIDRPFFGSVRNPVNMMALEHEYVDELLAELRHLTHGYEAPEMNCSTVDALYSSMRRFDLHTKLHIHLENNVFFPRSIEMEDRITIVDARAEW